ncbi:hypothetical protein OBBRIDRAFT_803275 [Obba rivulosa]|uniref:Uncharacterized protein n=1 Tax=Obba rivulosa TaxID=1052685 RepID=A0A8E2AVM4_9APHY|nr:hypothetical protein OBBRIDRAFT_803275 [Obba rivulosa]
MPVLLCTVGFVIHWIIRLRATSDRSYEANYTDARTYSRYCHSAEWSSYLREANVLIGFTYGLSINSEHPTIGGSGIVWFLWHESMRPRMEQMGYSLLFTILLNRGVLGGTASPEQGVMFAILALSILPTSIIRAKKKTNIGAIVRGVIAGLCVISIAVTAVLT